MMHEHEPSSSTEDEWRDAASAARKRAKDHAVPCAVRLCDDESGIPPEADVDCARFE
jgi:hypothetical protein